MLREGDANGSCFISAGILINVVGFAGAIGRDVPAGAQYLYNVNFFGGFIVAAGVYWGLCKISPIPACSDHWMEVGDAIDDVQLAYDGSDLERNDKLDGDTKMV
jgi:nucleobase:cation symporter-1, NCS1 family